MAGVKGRSGGARAGAGRPPKPPADAIGMEPMEFLEGVMQGAIEASPAQVSAAKALMAYKHRKLGDEGKKECRQKQAEQAASRFTAAPPPKLVASGGKRI